MATLLRVPEVAAGATEAILSEWLIQENASFSAGEPIVVLETEKAVVEVEAEIDAILLRRLVPAGSPVEVGSPMALLGDSSEKDADLDRLLAQLGVGEGTIVVKEALPRREVQGTHQAEHASMLTEEPTPAAEPPAEPAVGHARGEGVGAPIGQSRVFISPLARRLLKDAGVPIEAVTGTGPNRRIVRRDVERAVETADQEQGVQAATSSAEPSSATAQSMMAPSTLAPSAERTARFTDFPHSRLRRAVANRLTQSKQTIPHFYVKRTARIDALLDLRAQLNGVAEEKISVNDLVIRAVAAAHQQVPEANVTWTEDAIRRFDSVDIAVAIAGERGLVTPVLRSVETTSLSGIARSVKAFVQLANDGKLQQRDLEGGTISVTNLGMYGVEEFTAIINPPHAAILAVGAGRPAPAVVDGVLEVATQMTLVLSVDHRAIDGATAARWMDVLVHVIEEPLRLVV